MDEAFIILYEFIGSFVVIVVYSSESAKDGGREGSRDGIQQAEVTGIPPLFFLLTQSLQADSIGIREGIGPSTQDAKTVAHVCGVRIVV